jgi:hypothetical protein
VSSSTTIEAELASAIRAASAAGEWNVVARLAAELEARRQSAGAPDESPPAGVVDLAAERKRRS